MHTKLLVASCFCIVLLLCGTLLYASKTRKIFRRKSLSRLKTILWGKPVIEQNRMMPSLMLF